MVPAKSLRSAIGFDVAAGKTVREPEPSLLEYGCQEAREQVLKGKRALFEPFRSTLPKFYQSLVAKCGPLRILESEVFDTSLANFGQRLVVRRLALIGPVGVIDLEVAKGRQGDGVAGLVEFYSKLDSLPPGLSSLYDYILSYSLPPEPGKASPTVSYDLPSNLFRWDSLDSEVVRSMGLPMRSVRRLEELAGVGADLHVWIRGTVGTSVVVNYASPDRLLYCISSDPAKSPYVLNEPLPAIDEYFSNAVLGFPSESKL